MDSINLYLDSDQVMPYMEKLEEMNKFDPEHYDNIAYNFASYVVKRKSEIVKNYHTMRLVRKKDDGKFIISKSVMDYLSSLTGLSYVKVDNCSVKTLEKNSIKNRKIG